MAQATLSVRIDQDAKEAFAAFCEKAGLSVSTAINLFVRQTVRDQRIPFAISVTSPATASSAEAPLPLARVSDVVTAAAQRQPSISRVTLFGSYARGEARHDSDIDLRIEYDHGSLSMLELAAFSEDIRKATGKEVDVISKPDLGEDALAKAIEREGMVIYER